MVATLTAETALDVTVNEAVVAPAATVTEEGTLATALLLLERVTVAPPAGAAALSVTVPTEVLPPVTAAGDRLTDCST
jgi:hypothetical protein